MNGRFEPTPDPFNARGRGGAQTDVFFIILDHASKRKKKKKKQFSGEKIGLSFYLHARASELADNNSFDHPALDAVIPDG